ncbi:MAG TPA: hypothetical protein VKD69_22650 [Vicinamibacterales bacterium]|nr:hypothetical protein [Vicinamibacterales bacterium]
MIGPTPLLDFFKRGEVARDVRMEAAQGTLAPRAYEQLAILILLLEDPDREIRDTAEGTLSRIPEDALKTFLARADVPIAMREFFADRGIFPDETPSLVVEAEQPLVEATAESTATAENDESLLGDENEDRQTATQRLATMNFSERLKAAVKGSREMRAILIRDANKLIASSVLSSPKLSEPEVEGFAKMQNVSDEVLRIIGTNRAWMKNYGIVHSLTKNAKCPLTLSMTLMQRLNDRDLAQLSVDPNVPEPLRIAARKKVVAKQSGKERS